LRDVTRRHQVEQQARQLELQLLHSQKFEALGQLAGGVAHDFNNLLTIVAGYATLLQRESSSRVREYGRYITEAQQRGANLTRQLLTFARKEVVRARPLCLGRVLRDMWPLVRRVVPENVSLQFEPTDGCWIVADPGQIEQVVLNLAANARDAMPDGGELRVGCRVCDVGVVELTVADNGRGMAADVRSRIFEPFFTTKERGKGTGLGLATVGVIVSQQGGTVEVASALNHGAIFTVRWPRSELQPVEECADNPPSQEEGGRERVLVAEDDDAVRMLIEQVLSQAGYRVLLAHDGNEAVDTVNNLPSPPDLVLTDVIMPGMNGIDVARTLRLRFPELRVLYTSGYLDDIAQDVALDPARELLVKPFTASDLLQRVRKSLDAPRRH
jgi:two-component system cell cycle sensor histidine kinase/response regulator CckA